MEYRNPFESALANRKIHGYMRDASTHITDTLDLAWSAARAVFGDAATPEHALAICAMFVQRADALKQAHIASLRWRDGTDPAPPPAPLVPAPPAKP